MQSLCSLQMLYVMVTFSLSKIILKEEEKKKKKLGQKNFWFNCISRTFIFDYLIRNFFEESQCGCEHMLLSCVCLLNAQENKCHLKLLAQVTISIVHKMRKTCLVHNLPLYRYVCAHMHIYKCACIYLYIQLLFTV